MTLLETIETIYQDFNALGATLIVILGLSLAIAIFTGVIGTASIFVLNGLFHLGLEYNLYNYGVTTIGWLLLRKLFKQYKD
jgi:hypothetical protein